MATILPTKKEAIRQGIAAAIRGGKYNPGERIDAESKLATQWGVSVWTVRHALDELERDGLVERVHGSGTYVKLDPSNSLAVYYPELYPKNIINKHLWGKMLEHAHRGSRKITLKEVAHRDPMTREDLHWEVSKLFSNSSPVSFYKVTMNDLGWLVDKRLCEDLTASFSLWPQRNNLYQIALDAVTCENRIYGIPSHSTLSVLAYHKDVFERAGLDPKDTVGSLDGLVRTLETLLRSGNFKSTLCMGTVRPLVMTLLRGFYPNLYERFSHKASEPVEREVGQELLSLLYRLRWELGVNIPTERELTPKRFDELWTDFATGRDAISMIPYLPQAYFREYGARDDHEIGFIPFALGPDRKPFTLFNCYVFIVNPAIDADAKEFITTFLQDYAHPQSQMEIDRRYVEEGRVSGMSNPFIKVPPRVPDDPEFEEYRRELFQYAEKEIPFPSPSFDQFVMAARRVVFDPESKPEKEYEFYLEIAGRASEGKPSAVGLWGHLPKK